MIVSRTMIWGLERCRAAVVLEADISSFAGSGPRCGAPGHVEEGNVSMWANRHLFCALAIAGLLLPRSAVAYAQSPSVSDLTVNAREVLVPVTVQHTTDDAVKIWISDRSGYHAGYREGLADVLDLTAKDFHVFEDGKAVQVARVDQREFPWWMVIDNVAAHATWSEFLSGRWDSPDGCTLLPFCAGSTTRPYFLYFIPLASSGGLCHKISVTIDRPRVPLHSRQEYCDSSTPADPLGGSKIGKQLEADEALPQNGKIPLAGQVGFLLSESDKNVIDLRLEFPWTSTRPDSYHAGYFSSVGMMGLVYATDGTLVLRFSEPGNSTIGYTDIGLVRGAGDFSPNNEMGYSMTGYERQAELSPGSYILKLALTNGHEYGKVELSLTVPKFDSSKLWMSSVILCKRFHKPENAPGEAERRPPQYVPLMSQGIEFTPTGDIHFRRGDSLVLWFQIRPPDGSVPTERETIMNADTGAVVADGGSGDLTLFRDAKSSVLNVAKKVDFSKYPPGNYRVRVQATDKVSGVTVERFASFVVMSR